MSWTDPDWQSIYQLFSKDRLYDALTDYSVQKSGSIVRLNDPRGTRSPYANGGSDGLEGDGVGFVRTLGIDAINGRLVSIEREGKEEPFTRAQLIATAKLEAYWFDQAKVPWDAYPFNPNVGCVTDIEHFEFATKQCPFGPKRAAVNERQDMVRGILKAAQTKTAPAPTPPPGPVENPSNHTWPNGWTTAQLAARFGQLVLFDAAGEKSNHAFDENGQISNAWAARGAKDGITDAAKLPKPLRWNRVKTTEATVDVIIFDTAGAPDWILYNPHAGDRAGYRWVS